MPAAPAPTISTSVFNWSIKNTFINTSKDEPDCKGRAGQGLQGIFLLKGLDFNRASNPKTLIDDSGDWFRHDKGATMFLVMVGFIGVSCKQQS
jgi:hypothetical protein